MNNELTMNAIAIIPARGGSRRLLRKNVLSFCGKPLLEWTIIQARCARCFTDDDIYLSTDDDEIAAIGERNNIHVIRRPDWTDADQLSAGPVIIHALDQIEKIRSVTHMIVLLPTSPCRHPDDIDRVRAGYQAIKKLHPDCRAVCPLVPMLETVVYQKIGEIQAQMILMDKHWRYLRPGPAMTWEEIKQYRGITSQLRHDSEMDMAWEEYLQKGAMPTIAEYSIWPGYYISAHWYQSFDIDNKETFDLNEVLFKQFILEGRGEAVYWDYKAGGGK